MVDMEIAGKAQLTWKAGDSTAKRPAAMSEHQYLLKRYLGEDGQPRFTSSAPVIGVGGSPFTNMRSLEDQVRSLEEAIQHSPIGFGREVIGEVIEKCVSFFEDANATVQADMERLLPERNKEKQHKASEEGKVFKNQASTVAMGEGGAEMKPKLEGL